MSSHLRPSLRLLRCFVVMNGLAFSLSLGKTQHVFAQTAKENKVPEQPTLQRPTRFRGGTCWLTYKKLKEDLKRYRTLSTRISTYQCDEEAELWKRCRSGQEEDACQKELHQKRWLACFRIRRRMRVMTARLEAFVTLQKKQRCRWKLKLPKERFTKQLFATPTSPKR